MTKHIERTRDQLGELAGLADKTEAAERQILAASEKRLAELEPAISKLAPGIEGAADADQEQYLDLVKERGQLQVVISKSKAALGL